MPSRNFLFFHHSVKSLVKWPLLATSKLLLLLLLFGLKTTENYFSQFWRLKSPRKKVLANLMSGENPLPRWLSFPCNLTWWKREKEFSQSCILRVMISFMRAPPSWPKHFPKATLLILSHCTLGFHMSILVDMNILVIIVTKEPIHNST